MFDDYICFLPEEDDIEGTPIFVLHKDVEANKEGVSLEEAFKAKIPFIVFGLPDKLINYIKENAEIVENDNKEEKFAFYYNVESPFLGFGGFFSRNKNTNLIKEGYYSMTINEAQIYQRYFGNYFETEYAEDILTEEQIEYFDSLN